MYFSIDFSKTNTGNMHFGKVVVVVVVVVDVFFGLSPLFTLTVLRG